MCSVHFECSRHFDGMGYCYCIQCNSSLGSRHRQTTLTATSFIPIRSPICPSVLPHVTTALLSEVKIRHICDSFDHQGWWEEDREVVQSFWNHALNQHGAAPDTCTTEVRLVSLI